MPANYSSETSCHRQSRQTRSPPKMFLQLQPADTRVAANPACPTADYEPASGPRAETQAQSSPRTIRARHQQASVPLAPPRNPRGKSPPGGREKKNYE